MGRFMEKSQDLIKGLEGKGFSDQMIRLIQKHIGELHSSFERSLLLLGFLKASYELTADERLVKRVNQQLDEKIIQERKQIIHNTKTYLVHAGCQEFDIDAIANAVEEEIGSLNV